ncbi:transmembrane protein [Gossypium australe]|uniref:Transmembrane protein n=1 Tax=Gossypium australe TaxID=47621 RepID=A0A5B6VPK8_9ROSI|nr:transmembrane protein [Gossypium australe]
MAFAFLYKLQNLWPFSVFKFDDLRASRDLVQKLSIPDRIKKFVFAVRVPHSQSVIYILSVQNLSERSAADAECLIRELRPEAVVAQIGNHAALSDIQSEDSLVVNTVPTSSFEVLKRCFVDKINKDQYDNVAGKLVLREIFGVGFHGHFLAAKRAAREVGSAFVVLESPFPNSFLEYDPSKEVEAGSKIQGPVNSLVPQKGTSAPVSSFTRSCIINDVQLQMVKFLSSHINFFEPGSVSEVGTNEIQPTVSYKAPPFAQSIYPLLLDLHDIFVDLPSMGRALALSQKLLLDVNRGEVVDTRIISEVYTFRIAVEALRIALNNAGQLPIEKLRNVSTSEIAFSELPVEDKSHAILAQALQSQSKKFKTVVAIVDASSLAGLRTNWNTPVPPEVKDLVDHLVADDVGDGETSNHTDNKRLLSNKSVAAVGASATAVLGASSISKVIPASTVMKVVTWNVPASVKLAMTQTQKVVGIALGKTLGPSKFVVPGLANSGANSSLFKAAASAEKIRTVVHGVIASAEKTSFSAMRTAFYEIMRKRQVQPIGVLPWATFGCSIATCTSLLVYGDGIECAAESLPAAPSIASLGRGIQSLQQASQAVRQKDDNRIQKSIERLMYRLKKAKIQ